MAKRMVQKYGEDTLKLIEEEPEKLLEVEGVGPKRVDKIRKAWSDQKEIREVMVFLQSHGVSSTFAAKIFKQYGQQSIDVVKGKPLSACGRHLRYWVHHSRPDRSKSWNREGFPDPCSSRYHLCARSALG